MPDVVMEADVVSVSPQYDPILGGTLATLRPTSVFVGTVAEPVELVVPVGVVADQNGSSMWITTEGIPLPVAGEHVAVILRRGSEGRYVLRDVHSYYVRADVAGRSIVLGSGREHVQLLTCDAPIAVSSSEHRETWSEKLEAGRVRTDDPIRVAASQDWTDAMEALRHCYERL